MKQLTEALIFLSVWSVVLPAFAGCISLRCLSQGSRYIWLMSCCAVIPQLTRYITSSSSAGYIVYNLYLFIEFLFTLLYFLILMGNHSAIYKKLILAYASLFGILYTGLAVTRGFSLFFYELVCVNDIFVVVCVLTCYYNEIGIEGNTEISFRNPNFLYFAGWMFYTPLTLLLYSLWSFVEIAPESPLQYLKTIHSIGNVLMYMLFAYGFLTEKRSKKSSAFI